MLIPTQELVRDAQANHYALGAFNAYNLELVKGVIRGAECAHAPIILQLGAGQLQYGGYESLVALCLGAALAAAIPVALHLDHGTQLSDIQLFDTLRMELDKPHPTYDLRQLMNPVMDAIAELVASKLELLGSAAQG